MQVAKAFDNQQKLDRKFSNKAKLNRKVSFHPLYILEWFTDKSS
jgi:hypothetical protein